MSSSPQATQAPGAGPDLPGLLVDPAWLKDRLGDPGLRAAVRTVDLRERDAYLSGHVPGAVHLDLERLGSSDSGRDNVMIPPDAFGGLMAERGISNGDTVVAYDDQWGLAAARLVWALHYYGHDRAAVLNGGWDRWREEGGAAESGEARVAPGRFEPGLHAEVHADTAWIGRRIETDEAVLVDARTPAEFDGGHLPGAISWDWFNAVPAGSWDVSRDPGELLAEWRALGLAPSDDVVVYCRSGMRASHTWLVLRNAGFERVRLYDGSWQEWSMTMEGADGH